MVKDELSYEADARYVKIGQGITGWAKLATHVMQRLEKIQRIQILFQQMPIMRFSSITTIVIEMILDTCVQLTNNTKMK